MLTLVRVLGSNGLSPDVWKGERSLFLGKDLKLCELPNSSRSSYATIWVCWPLSTPKKLQMSNSRYRIEAEKKHTSPLQNSGLTEPVGPQDPPQRLTWNMLANMEKSGNIWVPTHLSLLPRFRLVAFFWNCFWNQWFWQVPFVDTKKASNEQF